jgi:SRSO17 transposase
MHHFIANAGWDDGAVLRVARETLLAALERHGPVAAWVVDDTGIPKKSIRIPKRGYAAARRDNRK